MLALAHHALRALSVVPEVGVFGGGVQFFETFLGSIPVKDASSAGRSPARFRQPPSRFRDASSRAFARDRVLHIDEGAERQPPGARGDRRQSPGHRQFVTDREYASPALPANFSPAQEIHPNLAPIWSSQP
jgi:hypothetical protein